MSADLSRVATAKLERLREAFASGRLRAPPSRSDLIGFGLREQLDTVADAFGELPRTACLAIVDAVLAERRALERPAPELVWTGPEGPQATARDTAVVLRRLFESARRRVVLAGYGFRDAESVLAPLHRAMRVHGVESVFFVDVEQVERRVADPERHGQSALEAFLISNWPFGPPHPTLYCDRRALSPGPPWCSLHAKCVAVDGERAFVSSANFTLRGQERNIETGVLLHDRRFAEQLERQWLALAVSELTICYRPAVVDAGVRTRQNS